MDDRIPRAAAAALHNCLAVQPGEKVIILADPSFWAVPLFTTAAVEADAPLTSSLDEAAVILCLTESVPRAAVAAVGRGARMAHLPNIQPETLTRSLFVDFRATAVRARHVASRLAEATQARILGEGVDLTLHLQGEATADTGILREPGAAGQLPAGEARRGPLGVGCNDRAVLWGDPLEDSKARGSVTVDGVVVKNPTLLLDGAPLVENGQLLTM